MNAGGKSQQGSTAAAAGDRAARQPVPPPPWTLRGTAAALLYRRGVLAFARYAESDVGPYDELFWLAPFQAQPGGRRHSVTRMYVSSELSVRGGRENWGMPKELASFVVTAEGADSERVQVTLGERRLASFNLHWSRPGIPFSADRLPRAARRLLQVLDGRCFETVPEISARLYAARFAQVELDPDVFPDAHASRSRLGVCLRDLRLLVPAPQVWPER
jgi:hypothetical protein